MPQSDVLQGPSSENGRISSDPSFLENHTKKIDSEGAYKHSDPPIDVIGSSEDQTDELDANGFIKLNTHDVSFVEGHIPDIEKFAEDLQVAINAAWPTRNKSRYENVNILLLSWEDDNLGVEQEIKRLEHVFSNLYRFDVREFRIPRKTPGRATIFQVSTFLGMDAHDTLFIVYYAGHARLSHQTNEPPIWAATDKTGSPTLPSGGVQQLLEEAESDVLLLYDSCHSSHPAVSVTGQGVTEVIAACGFETKAPAVGPHSFTNALIRELEECFAGPPISVAALHGRVISSLKNWKPSLLRDENGNVWTDENGQAKYECYKRRTPVHCFLTNESPYRSIMLTPLPPKLSLASVADMGSVETQSATGTSDEIFYSAHSSQISSFALPTTLPESSKLVDSLQVLLAIRLEDDYFLENAEDDGKKIRTWCNWLKTIPDGAQNITIQGLYKSCSALVILSLPIALWDLLPENAAYSFIGFVNSTNLVKTKKQPSVLSDPGLGNLRHEKLTSTQGEGMTEIEKLDAYIKHVKNSWVETCFGEDLVYINVFDNNNRQSERPSSGFIKANPLMESIRKNAQEMQFLEKLNDLIAQRERNHEKTSQLCKIAHASRRDSVFLEKTYSKGSIGLFFHLGGFLVALVLTAIFDSESFLICWVLSLPLTISIFVFWLVWERLEWSNWMKGGREQRI